MVMQRHRPIQKTFLASVTKGPGENVRFISNRPLNILVQTHYSPVRRCCYYSTTATSDSLIVATSSSHVPTESLAWYNPVQYVMDVAHLIHDMTGLPYAGAIVCITAMGRMALFPLMISSQRVDVKGEKVQADLERFQKTKPSSRALDAKLKSLRRQYGYNPWQKLILPLSSIALTAYMWFGLRWMGYYYPDELSTGGILWFIDLTREDPLHLLPILSGTTCLLMVEVGADFKGQVMTPRRKLIGRGLAITFIPILVYSPASVHIFWTSNWLISALQDVFISQPGVRDKLGIAKASERETPIVFIKDVIKDEVIKQNEGNESTVETNLTYRKINKISKNKKKKRR